MPIAFAFLQSVPLFGNIEADALPGLAGCFVPARIGQGDPIFHQGDSGQTLYLIEQGQVRIYVLGEDGHEQSVIVYGARDVFGELAVIDERPRSASAVALRSTLVWVLSREQFREQMRRSPQLTLNFMRMLSDRLRYTTQQVNSLASQSVAERLARKLIELTRDHGVPDAEGVRLELRLTQSDLASLIGATRESINKTLRAFQRQGLLILRQGQIVILSPARLYEHSTGRAGTAVM